MQNIKIIKGNIKYKKAFEKLRFGYPIKPPHEQTHGKEFRTNSEIIIEEILKNIKTKIDPNNTIVLLPWRSALAFVQGFKNIGINNFYHLSSKRNEKTLETEVDFEEGSINPKNKIIIADPMLASGNTIIDTVERCLNKKISIENIEVISILSAPEGIQKIIKRFPNIKITTGCIDKKLDEKGYIVPGLVDFGDKYFSEFKKQDLDKIIKNLKLSKQGKIKLHNRIKEHGVKDILKSIIDRDNKDEEIDIQNRKNLTQKGLKIQKPKKQIEIDTGHIQGIHKVYKIIKKEIDKFTKIISIEGKSGTGKSSTTKFLQNKTKAYTLSMGEIFRYLTILSETKNKKEIIKSINEFSYRIQDNELKIYHKNTAINKKHGHKMRSKKVENILPDTAKHFQKEVIQFCQNEIKKLKEISDKLIIIEGRSFTLDFFPSDLRIKLTTNPIIRAERRWHQ